MKAVIQRVKKAKVLINNLEERKIDFGLVVLLGIGNSDNEEDAISFIMKNFHRNRTFYLHLD